MADKAVFVGIETYPVRGLRGAVNDALIMQAVMHDFYHLDGPDSQLLTDSLASREAILKKLTWLVEGAAPGDRLLFYFSGHGMQLPTLDRALENGKLDEAICPHDIDPDTGANAIHDKELNKIFRSVPRGAGCYWICDSCSSRDLTKSMAPSARITKSMPAPRAAGGGLLGGGLEKAASELHLAMISACKSDATAQEDLFAGRRGGVLTWALVNELRAPGARQIPLSEIVDRTKQRVAAMGYAQEPGLEGDASMAMLPFWNF